MHAAPALPVRARVNISDPLEVSADLDLARLTLFIGPNLNGKSLVLRCIYTALKGEKYNLSLSFRGVEGCEVDSEADYVLYADPYMVTYYLYDKYRKYFESAEPEEGLSGLAEIGRDVRGPIDNLLDFKSLIRDEDLKDALDEEGEALNEIRKELSEVGHEEEYKYLLPLTVSVTRRGLEWRDAFGDKGDSVTDVTPFFYPAFVVTAAVYAYAMSKESRVVLLLDEPEAFSYPSSAYAMGRIFRHLTGRSANLYVIAVTHSWDLFAGAYRGGAEWVKVYTYRREGRKVAVEPLRDDLYIPGFSVSALLR